MVTVVIDEALLNAAKDAVGEGDTALIIEKALRELADRHRSAIIPPADEAAYQEAIEGLIALGGKEPDLLAPPRRRMW